MNLLRITLLVLTAVFIPGGLILVLPLAIKWLYDTRNRWREQAREELTPASGEVKV